MTRVLADWKKTLPKGGQSLGPEQDFLAWYFNMEDTQNPWRPIHIIYNSQPHQICHAMHEKEANTRMATTPDNIKIDHFSTKRKPVGCLFQ